jgi:hypothetical protein
MLQSSLFVSGKRWDLVQKVVAIVLFGAFLPPQIAGPEHKVEGNVITSERDPAVRIGLPSSAQYLGAQRWVLYGMADCELHAFVDATPKKLVQRLYWLQFESYLPTRPELKHTYDSPRHANLGRMDFYVDSWVRTKEAETPPGSDVEHITALIRENGYHMPEGMMYVRLVHLLDEQKRKELMIIYGEDVVQNGLTAPDLEAGGKEQDRWPAIAEGLLERAEKKIAIEQTAP